MAILPEPTSNLVPEGHYSFKIKEEPEVRKTGDKKWVIIRFEITNADGNSRPFSDIFFPGDEKYHRLLFCAGAEPDEKGVPHLSSMDTRELVGVEFDGDIAHIPDRKDPQKIRDTIQNIVLPGEKESMTDETPEEDEVPF